ncbi:tripartite tricarboxylate transporter permease [Metabacillus endolithicus]|uniref:Tripartite tricarboxylate transporter permease n=1 Tax=Metabacillus endolithicus TaxID=1535204 RepID=A0ABW5C2S2_9BACI|nr:tripartite tricarboxylate transporter permease [Metabacillus endolithicus]UPG62498.1 tripartite tricarboxylate transporter permease [Metabacillus endolithicus]
MTELFSNLATGLSVAFSPHNLLFLVIGVFVGMVVGIFPGFGPSAGIAILLPMTFGLEPTTAIIMLAGIYYGSMYGATITSILINTPGEAATVASTIDGYPLARNGRAGPALVMQAVASFVGGTIGVILICAFAPSLSNLASSFGPPEYFMIIALGLLLLTTMMGENKLNGLISALFGFAISTVGVDIITGAQRYTFGSPELIGGIDFVVIAIGLFGIGELLYCIHSGLHREEKKDRIKVTFGGKGFWPDAKDFIESKFTLIRGSILGFIGGVLPGSGATLGSIMAYSLEKKVSKTPEKFGKGHMPGLVAPEAGNNAASAGAMVPMLTLGIPGSGSTAVLLGAFLMWGLTPGPLFMEQNPEFSWGLITSMYLGNMMLLLVNIVAIPLFVKLLDIPYKLILPAIIILCIVGTFSLHGNIVEVWFLLIAGVIGFFMKLYGYSPAAVVLALVLAPLAEKTLRQSLLLSEGSLGFLVTRPITLGLLISFFIIVFASVFFSYRKGKNINNNNDITPR